jgi:hypothetical protein
VEPVKVPIGAPHHAKAAFMHGTVMATTESCQLRQRRGAAERPWMQMVRVTAAGLAAGKLTMSVSRLDGAADRRWHCPSPAPDIQHRPVGAVLHDDDRGIAQKTLRRFRGNVRSTVANFDDSVTSLWPTSAVLRRR